MPVLIESKVEWIGINGSAEGGVVVEVVSGVNLISEFSPIKPGSRVELGFAYRVFQASGECGFVVPKDGIRHQDFEEDRPSGDGSGPELPGPLAGGHFEDLQGEGRLRSRLFFRFHTEDVDPFLGVLDHRFPASFRGPGHDRQHVSLLPSLVAGQRPIPARLGVLPELDRQPHPDIAGDDQLEIAVWPGDGQPTGLPLFFGWLGGGLLPDYTAGGIAVSVGTANHLRGFRIPGQERNLRRCGRQLRRWRGELELRCGGLRLGGWWLWGRRLWAMGPQGTRL